MRLRRVIRVAIVKYDWKVSLPLRQDVPTCEAELENFPIIEQEVLKVIRSQMTENIRESIKGIRVVC
jgi:hypothetical protein